MKISEYRSTAARLLKGRYGEAFAVTSICLFVFVTFRAAAVLFSGDDTLSPLREAVVTVLCFAAATPVVTGGVWWFFQTVCGKDNGNILKLYSGFRLNRRAAVLYLLMWVKGFLSLFPSAACFSAVYVLVCGNTGLRGDLSFFAAVQIMAAGIVLLGLYFSAFASMAAAPFIFIHRPDRNPFGVIMESAKLMRGRKMQFTGLVLRYVPAMLPVVTIPFVIPYVLMASAVFAKNLIDESNHE